jgi:hypothetical protein
MNQAKLRRLEEIYASLPKVECRRLCQKWCGPISLTPLEYRRLPKKPPIIDRTHDLALVRIGRDNTLCALLKDGECSAYERRPLICRLFGVWRKLPCGFGCKPERWIKDDEAHEIMAEVQRLS